MNSSTCYQGDNFHVDMGLYNSLQKEQIQILLICELCTCACILTNITLSSIPIYSTGTVIWGNTYSIYTTTWRKTLSWSGGYRVIHVICTFMLVTYADRIGIPPSLCDIGSTHYHLLLCTLHAGSGICPLEREGNNSTIGSVHIEIEWVLFLLSTFITPCSSPASFTSTVSWLDACSMNTASGGEADCCTRHG